MYTIEALNLDKRFLFIKDNCFFYIYAHEQRDMNNGARTKAHEQKDMIKKT